MSVSRRGFFVRTAGLIGAVIIAPGLKPETLDELGAAAKSAGAATQASARAAAVNLGTLRACITLDTSQWGPRLEASTAALDGCADRSRRIHSNADAAIGGPASPDRS